MKAILCYDETIKCLMFIIYNEAHVKWFNSNIKIKAEYFIINMWLYKREYRRNDKTLKRLIFMIYNAGHVYGLMEILK